MIRSPLNDSEWEAYFNLRFELLRAPWNQPKGSEQTIDEKVHKHFAYFNLKNEIIGVGRLDKIDEYTSQIRFMATLKTQQRQGIGSALINKIELSAKQDGSNQIFLHARENALDFYLKLGYKTDSMSYILFDRIQHYLMIKSI